MKDETLETIFGMGCFVALAVAALIIDGSMGEAVLAVVSFGLGAIVRHVWPSSEAITNATEVSK